MTNRALEPITPSRAALFQHLLVSRDERVARATSAINWTQEEWRRFFYLTENLNASVGDVINNAPLYLLPGVDNDAKPLFGDAELIKKIRIKFYEEPGKDGPDDVILPNIRPVVFQQQVPDAPSESPITDVPVAPQPDVVVESSSGPEASKNEPIVLSDEEQISDIDAGPVILDDPLPPIDDDSDDEVVVRGKGYVSDDERNLPGIVPARITQAIKDSRRREERTDVIDVSNDRPSSDLDSNSSSLDEQEAIFFESVPSKSSTDTKTPAAQSPIDINRNKSGAEGTDFQKYINLQQQKLTDAKYGVVVTVMKRGARARIISVNNPETTTLRSVVLTALTGGEGDVLVVNVFEEKEGLWTVFSRYDKQQYEDLQRQSISGLGWSGKMIVWVEFE